MIDSGTVPSKWTRSAGSWPCSSRKLKRIESRRTAGSPVKMKAYGIFAGLVSSVWYCEYWRSDADSCSGEGVRRAGPAYVGQGNAVAEAVAVPTGDVSACERAMAPTTSAEIASATRVSVLKAKPLRSKRTRNYVLLNDPVSGN